MRFLASLDADKVLAKVASALEAGTVLPEELSGLIRSTHDTPGDVQVQDDLRVLWLPTGWKVTQHEGRIAYVTDGLRGGVIPTGVNPDASWSCPHCGNYGPWNGVICQTCGRMSDPGD
jgi:hypothetical protein